MTKIRLLTLSVIGLVVLNLVLAVFLIMGRPGHRQFEGPRHRIIEKLRFTEPQVEAYDALIEQHRNKVRELDHMLVEAKTDLYLQTIDEDPVIVNDQLARISNLTEKLEEVHYQHFIDLKKICTEEQIPAFEQLARELASVFSRERPQRPKP